MSHIILEWAQAQTPDLNEIWKDIDGGGYTLLNTIAGNTTYTDTAGTLGSGHVWTYKVRGKNNGETGAFSNVGAAASGKSPLFGTAISEPDWVLHFGDMYCDDPTLVDSFSMPSLKRVYGALGLDAMFVVTAIDLSSLIQVNYLALNFTVIPSLALPALTTVIVDLSADQCGCTTINWTALATVGGNFNMDGSGSLTSVNLPALVSVAGNLTMDSCSSLTTISMASLVSVGGILTCDLSALTSASFPLLATVGGNVSCGNNTGMTTLNLSSLVYQNGNSYLYNNCALNAASIQGILARATTSGVTSANIQLNGGTNAGLSSISGAAQTQYANLVTAGNTMSINA